MPPVRPKQLGYSRKEGIFADHFLGQTSGGGSLPLITSVASTATITSFVDTASIDRPGIARVSSGLTVNANALLRSAYNINFGSGYWEFNCGFRIVNYPNATNAASYRIGFADAADGSSAPTDGVFLYVDANNLLWVTDSNGSVSTIAPGVSLSGNVWYDMKIAVSGSGTLATFTINGVSKTLTTNIPNAVGRDTGINFQVNKTAGTTVAAILDIDYYDFKWILN